MNKGAGLVFAFLGITIVVGALYYFFFLKSTNTVSSGEFCGGIANISCPQGYYCQDIKPVMPDQGGVCKPEMVLMIKTWINNIFASGSDLSPKPVDNMPTPAGVFEQASQFPQVLDDGTIMECIEVDEEGYCGRIGYIYSVTAFNDKQDAYRGEEVKIIGVADQGAGACTLMGCPGVDKCCNSCRGSLVIRDENGNSDEDTILNLVMEGESETLKCSGDECSMTCTGPLEVGQKYIFTGVLDGEVEYRDNGEPYITDKFIIKKYEMVD